MEIRTVWWLVGRTAKKISTQKETWQAVVTFLICGMFVVTVFTLYRVLGFLEWKWKFMRDSRKLSFLFPALCCHVSPRMPLAQVLFTIPPKWRACLQATKETIIDPHHSTFYMISMECQFSVIEAQISAPSVTLFRSAMIVKWKCKTFLILLRSKINKYLKKRKWQKHCFKFCKMTTHLKIQAVEDLTDEQDRTENIF